MKSKFMKRIVLELPSIAIGIAIGFIVTGILGADPLYDFFHPPYANVTVEAMLQPVMYDSEYHARFSIVNTGTMPLTNVYATYRFKCFMNESAQALLQENTIGVSKDGGKIHFDVPFGDDMDVNCAYGAPAYYEIYRDSRGNRYLKCFNVSNEVCMFCEVTVEVIAKEIANVSRFNLSYPFSKGNISTAVTEDCVTEEQIEKYGLNHTNTITATVFDFSSPCILGKDIEWCKEQGYL